MNILFYINPNNIHDVKKVSFFSKKEEHNIFYIRNKAHNGANTPSNITGAKFLKSISFFSVLRFYKTIKTFFWLKNAIKKHKIDAFIIIYAEPNALWSFFRKQFGIPIIIFTYGSDVLLTIPAFKERKTNILSKIIYLIYKKSFRNADYIISTSKSQTNAVKKIIGNQFNYEIIRTGVNFKIVEKNDAFKHPLNTDKHHFIFFPRLMHPVYQHEFAIDSINMLPKTIKNKYGFIFINNAPEGCPYFEKINSMAKNIKDADIVFLPRLPQEQIMSLYKMSSLAVMTPASDGSPVSAMEAMACKTPVILPPLDYDSDIFNNDTVTFFEEWTPESLALCTEKLLQPSAELDKKTNNAYDVIYKYGNYETEMQRLENIIKALVKTNKNNP